MEQQRPPRCSSPAGPFRLWSHNCIENPTRLCPSSLRMAAAVELSTPPLMATAIRHGSLMAPTLAASIECICGPDECPSGWDRSEEHTSELQSLAYIV